MPVVMTTSSNQEIYEGSCSTSEEVCEVDCVAKSVYFGRELGICVAQPSDCCYDAYEAR
jgi:hypothetical protein